MSHTRKTHLHFNSVYFQLGYIGYWSQRRTVAFLQRKPLRRSTTHSTVGICTRVWKDTAFQQPALTLFKTRFKCSMQFDNTLTLFPFCIQEHCRKNNAKEWIIPVYFWHSRKACCILGFRNLVWKPKRYRKMFGYHVTQISQRLGYDNQSFIIVISPEYYARQHWYLPRHQNTVALEVSYFAKIKYQPSHESVR